MHDNIKNIITNHPHLEPSNSLELGIQHSPKLFFIFQKSPSPWRQLEQTYYSDKASLSVNGFITLKPPLNFSKHIIS